MRHGLCLLATACAIAACVETPSAAEFEEQVRVATAQALALELGQVLSITEIERAPAKISWRATTPSGAFMCDADDRLSLPQCIASDV